MIMCSNLGDWFFWFYFASQIIPPKRSVLKSFEWQVPVNELALQWITCFGSLQVRSAVCSLPNLMLHQKMHFKGYMDGNPFCHQKSSQTESHCKNIQLEADPSGVSPKLRKNILHIKHLYVKIA